MNSPAFILVRPQLGMNIGMAARAMWNFALADMRLVAPRDGWPNPDAGPPAAGADNVLAGVQLVDSVAAALADCTLTFATTVRPRHMDKPVVTPRKAAAMMRAAAAKGVKCGVLFGPERSGLTADDLAPVQTIVTCPVNPAFGSLNLAQAVLLVAHEWFQAADAPAAEALVPAQLPAPHGDLAALIAHLDAELERAGYFHVQERAPATRRMLAQLLTRPGFSAADIRTLRGVVKALVEGPRRPHQPHAGAGVPLSRAGGSHSRGPTPSR